MTQTQSLAGQTAIVTGGAGFIGSHLCDALIEQGMRVRCLDSLIAGKKENIEHLLSNSAFQFFQKDVTDADGWQEVFGGADMIFHNAASKKNVCLVDPHRDLEVNGGGTLNMLNKAREFGLKKFVHASTGSVYGEPRIFPTDETHPLDPVSYYGVSKLAGERYVACFNHLYGLDTVILRYFHVYGPRQESNEFGGVVTIFLRSILEKRPMTIFGDGHQERSFTFVGDIVAANVAVASSQVTKGKVYNVASGIKVSINDLAAHMKRITQAESPIVHGEPLIGDIYKFDVSNEALVRDVGLQFNKDFWGTLELSLEECKRYIAKDQGS